MLCIIRFNADFLFGIMFRRKFRKNVHKRSKIRSAGAGYGRASETQIYDFSLDDKINSIKIKTYQLTDGRWEIMSENESLEFTDSKGRIALQFEDISNELKVSVQGEHSNSAFSYFGEIKNDNDNMSISTSALTDTEKISYEKEIPLAVQIITSKDEVNSYDPSYFFKPDEYEKYGYEHVYAVTVTFIKGADYLVR